MEHLIEILIPVALFAGIALFMLTNLAEAR